MNKVILMGRLVRDPEVRYSQGNEPLAVARYTLAVNRRFRRQGEQDADFINCVAFNKQAENLARFIKKGGQIGVEGKLQTRRYTAQDGSNRIATEVICDAIHFLEPKGNSQGGYNDYSSLYTIPYVSYATSNSILGKPYFGEVISLGQTVAGKTANYYCPMVIYGY